MKIDVCMNLKSRKVKLKIRVDTYRHKYPAKACRFHSCLHARIRCNGFHRPSSNGRDLCRILQDKRCEDSLMRAPFAGCRKTFGLILGSPTGKVYSKLRAVSARLAKSMGFGLISVAMEHGRPAVSPPPPNKFGLSQSDLSMAIDSRIKLTSQSQFSIFAFPPSRLDSSII
ncbi:hypothetical protein Nepgr_007712 [Nepenthes gracilis]|uniref:Uncharacterized protein n=1 Tax=Nepenthes gracilis TaxID=150966 RepID=A0AAD3S7C8_NEPGR|nr:hypothetical protein Nepgr_007712 [Nepenthes gracilis]